MTTRLKDYPVADWRIQAEIDAERSRQAERLQSAKARRDECRADVDDAFAKFPEGHPARTAAGQALTMAEGQLGAEVLSNTWDADVATGGGLFYGFESETAERDAAVARLVEGHVHTIRACKREIAEREKAIALYREHALKPHIAQALGAEQSRIEGLQTQISDAEAALRNLES